MAQTYGEAKVLNFPYKERNWEGIVFVNNSRGFE